MVNLLVVQNHWTFVISIGRSIAWEPYVGHTECVGLLQGVHCGLCVHIKVMIVTPRKQLEPQLISNHSRVKI